MSFLYALKTAKTWGEGRGGGGGSQNLSSVTNDSFCYKLLKSLLLIGYQQICHWKKALWNWSLICMYLSSLMRAGMPPLLKIWSRPALWWERLCRVPAAHLVVSASLLLDIALTRAATIWGEFMMACRLASFLESWWTIMAAWFTTTYNSKRERERERERVVFKMIA